MSRLPISEMATQGGPAPMTETVHGETRPPIVTVVASMVTFAFMFATMFVKMTVAIRRAMSKEVAAKKSVAEGRHHAALIAAMHPATMAAAARTGIDLRQRKPEYNRRANSEGFPKKHPSNPCETRCNARTRCNYHALTK
jgi:hypothetical protein